MKIAIIAWDGPGGAGKREATRDAHFAYIEQIVDRIAVAGPLKVDHGAAIGSLLVYDVESEAEAEALFRGDPYFVANLWDRWTINRFVAAAGEWIGGKIW